jgi:hypothetical protein
MPVRSGSSRPALVGVPANELLNSWKEIARYLGTSVRTVQRWEQIEGSPVHRHAHARAGTVYACASEVDDWLKGRRTPDKTLRPRDAPSPAVRVQPHPPAGGEPAPRRLIVLPFHLVQPDPEIEFLAFSLADAITTSLSGVDRSGYVPACWRQSTPATRIWSGFRVKPLWTWS